MTLIKSEKPLCFIKIETTGTDYTQDRILEISVIKYDADKTKPPIKFSKRFNPGVPIPEHSSNIHGIKDADVEKAGTFADSAKKMYEFFGDCDFVGFNIRKFELPFLVEEFNRVNCAFPLFKRRILDLMNMESEMVKNSFDEVVYKHLNISPSTERLTSSKFLELSNSLTDAMIKNYEGKKTKRGEVVVNDFDFLSKKFNCLHNALDHNGSLILNDEGKPIFNFGSSDILM